jgi:hypothetical protein
MLDPRKLNEVSKSRDPNFSIEAREINGQIINVRVYEETKSRGKNYMRVRPVRNQRKK